MSVLSKITLGLEETEQRDRCCARWKKAMPEKGTCPGPHREPAQLSRNQPNVKEQNETKQKQSKAKQTKPGQEVELTGFPK